MAITEKQRHDLFNKLEETLGPDGAATLMDMLPPIGWADVATKADIGVLRGDMAAFQQATKADIGVLRGDMAAFQQATKADVAVLRGDIERLEGRFDGLGDVFATKAELHQELRGQTRTFVAWMVTSQATLAGIVALLVSMA